MRSLPSRSLALLALLVLAVPAFAGSESAPEVTDAAGDGAVCTVQCTPSQEFLDVLKGWVDVPDAGHVAFHLQIAGAPDASGAGAGVGVPDPVGGCRSVGGNLLYTFHFRTQDAAGTPLFPTEPGGAEVTDEYLLATRPCDTASAGPDALGWEFALAYTYDGPASSFLVQAPVSGSLAGSQFSWTLPRNATGVALPEGTAVTGYRIEGLAATSGFSQTAAVASGNSPVDHAPDSGAGLPFVFAAGGGAPRPIYTDVTTAALSIEASFVSPSNETHVYNWTNGESHLDLAFGASVGGGSAHVVVKDSANATVLDKTFPGTANGTQTLTSAKTGRWQVTVAYAGFTGSLRLSATRHAPTSTETTTGPPPTSPTVTGSGSPTGTAAATGSSTSRAPAAISTSTTKESPAAGALALLLAAGAVAGLARRRLR